MPIIINRCRPLYKMNISASEFSLSNVLLGPKWFSCFQIKDSTTDSTPISRAASVLPSIISSQFSYSLVSGCRRRLIKLQFADWTAFSTDVINILNEISKLLMKYQNSNSTISSSVRPSKSEVIDLSIEMHSGLISELTLINSFFVSWNSLVPRVLIIKLR